MGRQCRSARATSTARQFAERGLKLAREAGARDIPYVNLHPLAAIALGEGDHERAKHLFEEGASLALEAEKKVNAAFCLDGLAAIAAGKEDTQHAARLWGAAEAILEDISYPYAPDPALHEHRVSEARARLDEQTWERAWTEGRAMTPDEAVAYVLAEGDAESR